MPMTRVFIQVMATLAPTTMIAATAMITFVGATAIARAAMGFATKQILGFAAAQGLVVGGTMTFSAGLAGLAKAGGAVGWAARGASLAVRGLGFAFKRLIPFVGIALLIADVLQMAGLIKLPGFGKAEEARDGVLDANKEMAKEAERISRKMGESAGKLTDGVDGFKTQVDRIVDAEAPFLDPTKIDKITSSFERQRRQLEALPGGYTGVQIELEKLAVVREKLRKHEQPTIVEVKDAADAVQVLRAKVRDLRGQETGLTKQLTNLVGTLKAGTSAEAIRIGELHKANIAAAKARDAEKAATVARAGLKEEIQLGAEAIRGGFALAPGAVERTLAGAPSELRLRKPAFAAPAPGLEALFPVEAARRAGAADHEHADSLEGDARADEHGHRAL